MLAALLAGAIAAFITGIELITSKYQRTSAPTVTKAMEIFVTHAGRETLARVFPP